MSTTGTIGARIPQPEGGGARRRARAPHGFRRRDALSVHSMHFGPNMTPMVDVVMVILIFFMASAAFLGAEWFLRAAIPFDSGRGRDINKKVDPLALPPMRFDVVMDVDSVSGGTVVSFLDLNRVPLRRFLERIAGLPKTEETRQLELILKPTTRVPYRDVVAAHSACDAAGIHKLGIGVTRPAEAP